MQNSSRLTLYPPFPDTHKTTKYMYKILCFPSITATGVGGTMRGDSHKALLETVELDFHKDPEVVAAGHIRAGGEGTLVEVEEEDTLAAVAEGAHILADAGMVAAGTAAGEAAGSSSAQEVAGAADDLPKFVGTGMTVAADVVLEVLMGLDWVGRGAGAGAEADVHTELEEGASGAEQQLVEEGHTVAGALLEVHEGQVTEGELVGFPHHFEMTPAAFPMMELQLAHLAGQDESAEAAPGEEVAGVCWAAMTALADLGTTGD
ncbi:hypothetical protein BSKO_08556 [Bryopsis sp. KO-2023]|nr:hypothetical protein BSKO_08556 [Bryopsis sp. KO-2023]